MIRFMIGLTLGSIMTLAGGVPPVWSESEEQEDLPEVIKAFFAKEAPGFEVYEWLLDERSAEKGVEYRLYGMLNGQDAEIEVEMDTNGVPRELEIKYETDRSLLKFRDKTVIGMTNLPAAVTVAALNLVPGLELTSVRHGIAGIVDAYDVDGRSGEFNVSLKILIDGTIMELEKERVE